MQIDSMLAFNALSSLAAALAVSAAWRSVVVTRRAAEGQLLLMLLTEYSRPEMANSLRILGAWRNDHDANYAAAWKAARDAKDPAALQLDAARRMVSHFFFRIACLRRAKLIGSSSQRELCELDGLGVYFRVVEGFEEVINLNYSRWPFAMLKELCVKFNKNYGVHPSAPQLPSN